jgi:hypothetical protein
MPIRDRSAAASELKALKSLVRRFMKEVQWVPFRPADCNQEKVYSLIEQLADASVNRSKKKVKK